jgi:hypothetical protein
MAKYKAALAGRYRAALVKTLEELGYNGHDLTGFLYMEQPFQFCRKGNVETLIISSVASHSIYNKLRLDGKARALKEFHSTAVGALIAMYRGLSETPLKNYGVVVIYGASDFSEESTVGPLARRTEVLAVVSGRESCEKLAEGEITEQELADRSDIFVADPDAGIQLLRVKLRLE